VRGARHRFAQDARQPRGLDLADRVRTTLARGDGLLGDGDDVAGPHVGKHLTAEKRGEVVALADEVGPHGQARVHRAIDGGEQVLRLVRPVPGEEVFGGGAAGRPALVPARFQQGGDEGVAGLGDGAAVRDADRRRRRQRRLAVRPVDHDRAVAELAQPEFDVDRPPEEPRVLDLAAAAAAERLHDLLAAPERARLERGRLVEARERRSPRLDPAHLGRRKADLPAPPADLLGQRPLERLAQDPAAPPVADDGVGGQTQDVGDEFLVEVRDATLDRESHRVPVLVAQQAGQAVGEQVLEQAQLEVVPGPAVAGVARLGAEARREQVADAEALAALAQAPLDERRQHVARRKRLPPELLAPPGPPQLAQVDHLVGDVAGEQLVAALAVQQHGHLLPGEAHDAPLGVRPRADHGLFLVPHEVAQLIDELRRRRVRVGRVGAGRLDRHLDVRALVDGVAVEHGRERLEPPLQRRGVGRLLLEQLAHEADDGGRIEATREA